MAGIMGRAQDFLHSEEGPAATEYAIMLALIALVAIGSITQLGQRVDDVFQTIADRLPTSRTN